MRRAATLIGAAVALGVMAGGAAADEQAPAEETVTTAAPWDARAAAVQGAAAVAGGPWLSPIGVVGGGAAAQAGRRRLDTPDDLMYFVRGGGLPFGVAPIVTAVTVHFAFDPRETPLFFSASEGGETRSDAHRIPEYVVAIGASSLSFGLLGLPLTEARWYHLKGYAEAGLTTIALTEIAKTTFGRHRPDYALPVDPDEDRRRSFFSGHASETLFASTYFALFLRYHGLERFRPNGTWTWWEPIPYAALAGVSFYVPWTRVVDHRHHLSDVMVGGAVGATTSICFFAWQEHRWRRDSSGLAPEQKEAAMNLMVLPDVENRGLKVVGSW